MLGDVYTLEYTELFNAELAEVVRYITTELRNPEAAVRLLNRTEDAIQERLFAPQSFEPIPTTRDREYPYYRISIGNYAVLYCVIGNVMDVRRFVYDPSNWRSTI